MSEQIKKICENCDESSYGYGESSMCYGLRCSIKECSTDKNDTCGSFKLADHISKQVEIDKLQARIDELEEILLATRILRDEELFQTKEQLSRAEDVIKKYGNEQGDYWVDYYKEHNGQRVAYIKNIVQLSKLAKQYFKQKSGGEIVKDPERAICNTCYETRKQCLMGFGEETPDEVMEKCEFVLLELETLTNKDKE